MRLLSVLTAIGCFLLAAVGFISLLGWLNWFVLLGTLFGMALGAFGNSIGGVLMNLAVFIFSMVRLFIGGDPVTGSAILEEDANFHGELKIKGGLP